MARGYPITVRATDAHGNTFDKDFFITVADVDETPPDDPLPPGEDIPDDPGNFDTPPYTVNVDGGVKLAGKKKANGSIAKFLHDITDEVPLEAGKVYTMKYDPDFSLMSAQGVLAMIGFMFKAGNDFYLIGLRGDGAAGIHAYEVQGENKWNQTSGFVVDDGGAAVNGTQAGPNWIQLETSADGTTITFRTSGDDGDTWDDEYTTEAPTPFTNISEVTQWGPGAFFHGADDGPYSILVELWTNAVAIGSHRYWRINITDNGTGANDVAGLIELQWHTDANGYGSHVTGATVTADTEFDGSHLAGNAADHHPVDAGGDVWASTNSSFPHWLAFDFGSGNDAEVMGLTILGRNDSNVTQSPTAFDVQFSDDGSSWTTAWSESGLSWVGQEVKHFLSPNASAYTGSPHGSHEYWRMFYAEDDGGTIASASEIEMRSAPSGADQATGGTPTDGGNFGGFGASNAFDNNNSTSFFGVGSGTSASWVQYQFASAEEIAEITWRNRGDAEANQAPRQLVVMYSDDGSTWTMAWSVNNSTGWSLGQTRTFTDPNYV